MLQKFYCRQVFVGSVKIWPPAFALSSIVQIKHGIHIIHTESVHMVHLCPVKRIGDQEILYHWTFIIIKKGSPHRMDCHCRIRNLIKRCSVKALQSFSMARKMSRSPVQYHTDIFFMELIDQTGKILRHTISTVRCIVRKCRIRP